MADMKHKFLFAALLFTFPIYSSHYFAQGSLLYMQAEEGGLSYAVSDSKVKNLNFEWDFGFQIALGYHIPHDQWNLMLQWTNLQTHTDAHAHASHHPLFPTWQVPFAEIDSLSDAKCHFRLHLGLVDLFLNKPYLATPSLTLIPQLGIRYGSIRQKYNLDYDALSFRMKNKNWGIGPLAKLSIEYAFTKYFSLIAGAGASLLLGEFYVHQSSTNEVSKHKFLGLHSIYGAVSPIIEGSLSVQWQRNRVTLELGFDQFVLFSQNQLIHFAHNTIPLVNQGDLCITGAHFTIGFNF